MVSVTELIGRGRENATSRTELAYKLGVNDRMARKTIQDAKKRGAVICNLSDGKGYFIPTKQEEVYAYIRQEEARIRALKDALNPFYQELYQMRIDEIRGVQG